MQTCFKCKELKSLSDYGRDLRKKSGLQARCRACSSKHEMERYYAKHEESKAYNRARYKKNPGRIKDQNLRKWYGIDLTTHFEMIKNQHNKCFTCNKEFTKTSPACVDHCHQTGKVRDLLCTKCNTALGMVNDNVSVLKNLTEYIERHSKCQ